MWPETGSEGCSFFAVFAGSRKEAQLCPSVVSSVVSGILSSVVSGILSGIDATMPSLRLAAVLAAASLLLFSPRALGLQSRRALIQPRFASASSSWGFPNQAGQPTQLAPGTGNGGWGGTVYTGIGYVGHQWGHPSSSTWRDWRVNRDHRTTAVDTDPTHYGSGWTEKTKNQERR